MKKVYVLAVSVVAAISFVACGGGKTEQPVVEPDSVNVVNDVKEVVDTAVVAVEDGTASRKKEADKAVDAGKEKSKNLLDKAKEGAEKGKEGVEKAYDKSKDAVKTGAGAVKEGAEKAADKTKDVAKNVKDKFKKDKDENK